MSDRAVCVRIIITIMTHERTVAMARKVMLSARGVNAASVDTVLTASYYGGMAFSVIILIWPILILYYMNRPHVKAAFEGGTIVDGPAPYPPPGYR